jgi:hypothetical protein
MFVAPALLGPGYFTQWPPLFKSEEPPNPPTTSPAKEPDPLWRSSKDDRKEDAVDVGAAAKLNKRLTRSPAAAESEVDEEYEQEEEDDAAEEAAQAQNELKEQQWAEEVALVQYAADEQDTPPPPPPTSAAKKQKKKKKKKKKAAGAAPQESEFGYQKSFMKEPKGKCLEHSLLFD